MWAPVAPMPSQRFAHTATLLQNGEVLVAGGTAFVFGPPYVVSKDALLYDPKANTWTAAGSIDAERDDATASLLRDGRVLLVGGVHDYWYPFSHGEIYEPSTNTWSSSGGLNDPRAQHAAILLNDGRVLVTGGCTVCGGDAVQLLASAEIYDPSVNRWSAVTPMNIARTGHTATRLGDGRVLVVGGRAGSNLPTAEIYDPIADRWSFVPEGLVSRTDHVATALADGRALIVGGYPSCPAGSVICLFGIMQPEIYDPNLNTWKVTGDPIDQRTAGSLTLLDSGKVLLAGGVNFLGEVGNAELYDPVTNRWSGTGSLVNPRYRHTATLLENGRVLATGGSGGSTSGFIAAAELYKPAQRRIRK